jgi:hypothetical protein
MMKRYRAFLGRVWLAGAVLLSPALIQSQTVTLTSVADTALFQNRPNNNLGGVDFMPVGTTGIGTRNRGLVKFDVAGSVPAGATITSVSLGLRINQGGFSMQGVSLHRLLVDWGEGTKSNGPTGAGSVGAPATAGEATWNNRFAPSTPWGAAGGQANVDYAATASGSANVGSTGSFTWSSPGMAGDVRAWLNDPGSNFGWMILFNNESSSGTARRFASRESATVANRPRLTIEYETPLAIDSATVNGEQFQLTFQAQPGQSYIVQRRSDVGSGNWTTITNIPVQAAAGTITVSDEIGAGGQYYRVGRE